MIPSFFSPFAAFETFWCNCLYEIFCVSFGSSPTQIIAVLSFLSLRCLSIQFAEAFNVPSSNHLILTSSLLYLTSLIFLYGFIQVILLPSFFQKALLFFIDSLYFFWYWDLFAKPLLIHSGFVLKINSWFGEFSIFSLLTLLTFFFRWKFFFTYFLFKFFSSWFWLPFFRSFFFSFSFFLFFGIILILNSTHLI